MFKKLDLLIFKSFIGPLVITFIVALFVLVMQFLWLYVDELIGKGLSIWIIAKLLFYASAHLVPTALPLSVLLASVMTFGNLGEHFELTAIKAAGISLQRIMFPLIIFSGLLSYAAFYFANNLQPKSNLKFYTLLYDVKQQHPALDIREGIFNNDIEGYSIKIGDKHSNINMMYDFMIYDHTSKTGNNIVTIADSGTIRITDDSRNMIINLYNGTRYEEMSEDVKELKSRHFPALEEQFGEQVIIFRLDWLDFKESDESLFKHNYQMLNAWQLGDVADSLTIKSNERNKYFIDNFQKTKVFKNELKISTKDDTLKYGKRDSILQNLDYNKLVVMTNLDSLFNEFKKDKKKEIISEALLNAQSAQTDIVRAKEDLLQRNKWIAKHEIALHKKFTYAIACFIFFFIGAPLGAIIRKGGFGLPIIVSVLFFMFYYIMSMTGEKFAREVVWNFIIDLWGPSFVLLPIGVFLTYKATTDSSLLNLETYSEFFKKIFSKIKNLLVSKKNEKLNENTDIKQ